MIDESVHGNTTHGMSRTKIYGVWHNMRQRCYNPIDVHYIDYGLRGIQVCERWDKFENFYNDMGTCLEGMSLDRLDNNGDYTPENCKWSTMKEQARNRMSSRIITYNGESRTLIEWVEILGIDYKTLHRRLSIGWSVDRAFTQRVRKYD